jgi:hypothetical protein
LFLIFSPKNELIEINVSYNWKKSHVNILTR